MGPQLGKNALQTPSQLSLLNGSLQQDYDFGTQGSSVVDSEPTKLFVKIVRDVPNM